VPNLKGSIIERVKLASGRWTNLAVPKSKPNGKELYLKDRREGTFDLLWRPQPIYTSSLTSPVLPPR